MKQIVFKLSIIIMFFLALILFSSNAEALGGYGWGFKKNDDHQIPDVGKYKEILDEYGAYYADHSGEKVVYLTFDMGYEQGYTGDILDVLKKESVPATFFVAGHYVTSQPKLINRMVDEGHIIGNHSYHHPDFTILSKAAMKKELDTLEEEVAKVSEQKELKYLRPPKGVFNERTLKWSNELGYTHIFWSLAFIDWNVDRKSGWKFAFDQLMDHIHPGAIILLHTVSSDNAEALSQLIVQLKKDGYQFKSLDHLILKNIIPKELYGF
ncbi:delta-lactam-biosynthetic de-N-acetylase [Virgibacillus byunsanensis]|uniref:Delta-lactam-biosynthetic de-N-acetylase n=1 Tax=Virgibacillus byunsanensis TaxID=570945 RepID=A0ABW3LT83_9BACI